MNSLRLKSILLLSFSTEKINFFEKKNEKYPKFSDWGEIFSTFLLSAIHLILFISWKIMVFWFDFFCARVTERHFSTIFSETVFFFQYFPNFWAKNEFLVVENFALSGGRAKKNFWKYSMGYKNYLKKIWVYTNKTSLLNI